MIRRVSSSSSSEPSLRKTFRPFHSGGLWLAVIAAVLYAFYRRFVLRPPRLERNGEAIVVLSLILAIMVLPFITAISVDVFKTVPPVLKEAAYGVGCTTWEVVRNVVIPYTRVGVIGGIMLALGRALGETMAVTFVIGNSQRISASLFSPGSSIASTLANEFGEGSCRW